MLRHEWIEVPITKEEHDRINRIDSDWYRRQQYNLYPEAYPSLEGLGVYGIKRARKTDAGYVGVVEVCKW